MDVSGSHVPPAPPLPPVPPFPAVHESDQRVEQLLDGYERTKGPDQKGKLGDSQWKPTQTQMDQRDLNGTRAHELSPSEAREVWLEREVQSLRSVLDRMADQTSFKSSPYWSQGFQSGVSNQVSGMRASGNRDDTRAQHSLSSAFEIPHDNRAQHSSSGVADLLHGARVLNGASSAPALPHDGRALQETGSGAFNVPHDGRALQETGSGAFNVPHDGRALHGSGSGAFNVPRDGRALHGSGSGASQVPHDARASQAFSSAFGVCPGDRASSMEKSQYDGDRLLASSTRRGVSKGHRAMVLCMEHGRTLVVGE